MCCSPYRKAESRPGVGLWIRSLFWMIARWPCSLGLHDYGDEERCFWCGTRRRTRPQKEGPL